MVKVARIVVQAPGERADALLACLREAIAPDGVTVHDSVHRGDVVVTDADDRVSGRLHDYLVDALDECTRQAGAEWREHLSVSQPES